MTYLTEEIAGADPVELYEFIFGADTWRFTDSDAAYNHPITGDLYTPEMMSRGRITQSEEDQSMSTTIEIDAGNPVADFFRTPYLPTRHVFVTIYRTHRGSVAAPGIIFEGVIGQVEFSGNMANLSCVPTRHVIGRRIPIQLVQKLCTNTLYDQRCKVLMNIFETVATITNVSGLILTMSYGGSSGHPVGYFDGGMIEKVGKPPATIKTDNAPTLELLYNPGYVIGDVIKIHPGCDKRLSTCKDKFNNTLHFQAFPFMPARDPFVGEIM